MGNYDDFKKFIAEEMERTGVTREQMHNEFRKYMEQHDDWKTLYARIYQGVEKYGSPKRVAETYFSALNWVMDGTGKAPAAMQAVYAAACRARDFAFPAFFVEPEFLAAAMQTRPPEGMRWDEIKLPFEAGVFCLPRGSLKYIDGSEVNHVGWMRARAGEQMTWGSRAPIINNRNAAFLIYAQPDNFDGTILFSNLNADEAPYISDEEIRVLWHGAFDLPLAEGDDAFIRQCRMVCFSLLLAMQARPQLVSTGQRTGKRAKKGGREFWTPNIMGRGFRVLREVSGETGTHASPRLHWRRGDFRAQRFGPGYAEVKTIWIEPALIGQNEAGE